MIRVFYIVFISSLASLAFSGYQLFKILRDIQLKAAFLEVEIVALKKRATKEEKDSLEFIANYVTFVRCDIAKHVKDFHIIESEHKQSELLDILDAKGLQVKKG